MLPFREGVLAIDPMSRVWRTSLHLPWPILQASQEMLDAPLETPRLGESPYRRRRELTGAGAGPSGMDAPKDRTLPNQRLGCNRTRSGESRMGDWATRQSVRHPSLSHIVPGTGLGEFYVAPQEEADGPSLSLRLSTDESHDVQRGREAAKEWAGAWGRDGRRGVGT